MTGAMTLALLLFLSVGLAVRALVARGDLPPLARPDDATPTFLLGYLPRVVAAVVFSGVAAAIMSTVSSFLSVGAAAITHDLPRAFARARPRDDVRALRAGRVWTVLLCVAGAVLAQASGTLVAFLGIFGYGLFAATTLPALAAAPSTMPAVAAMTPAVPASFPMTPATPPASPPITVNLQVDGTTLATAVHRADRDTATRSFSPVPAY